MAAELAQMNPLPLVAFKGGIRPDLYARAQLHAPESAAERQELLDIYNTRFMYLLANGIPIPKEMIEGVNEPVILEDYQSKSLPLPTQIYPKLKDPQNPDAPENAELKKWEQRAAAELAKLLPQSELTQVFDHGREILGNEENSSDILKRMEAVMLGKRIRVDRILQEARQAAGLDEQLLGAPAEEVEVPDYESLGLKAFDFQLSELVNQGAISPENFARWKKLTRLGDFRMRVFVTEDFYKQNSSSLAQAILNSGIIFKGEMGWLSCLETMEQIPGLLTEATGNGVFITYDIPGMLHSPYEHPKEILTDTFLSTLQQNNFAIGATWRLLGLDREEIDQKPQETIAHSKEATAQLYKGNELFRHDRGHILLAPVPEQGFWNGLKVKLLLGLGTRLGDINALTKAIARDGMANPLLNMFISRSSRDIKDLHRYVLKHTDLTVISSLIIKLLQTEVPVFPMEKISSTSLRIFMPADDDFIHYRSAASRILRGVNRPDIVRNWIQGHYAFSYADDPRRMDGNETEIDHHLQNRRELIESALTVAHNIGWKDPRDARQHEIARDLLKLAADLSFNENLDAFSTNLSRKGYSNVQILEIVEEARRIFSKKDGTA